MIVTKQLAKDEGLHLLSRDANVAQFVSFASNLTQRFVAISSYSEAQSFLSPREALQALLGSSIDHSINLRSFQPSSPKGNEFVYGVRTLDDAVAHVYRLGALGLHVIANETIAIDDGGVSGVVHGGLIEFAPDDTPRCVEKPGAVSASRSIGLDMLRTIYGFEPALDFAPELRIEFSVHPIRRGLRREHTIIWEIEAARPPEAGSAYPRWPNRLSHIIGDKTFGLLVASLAGLRVPATIAIPRRIAPFRFGQATGSGEPWLRTSPAQQQPGRFTSKHGWIDPFTLLNTEDPDGEVASLLWQEAVAAEYSGALLPTDAATALVEGVRGSGERFMLSEVGPAPLPHDVVTHVQSIFRAAVAKLGLVRFEWVHDRNDVWIVQLHLADHASSSNVVFPGKPERYETFQTSRGIDELRRLTQILTSTNLGVRLVGNVGLTSHMCDLLRGARIPSLLELR